MLSGEAELIIKKVDTHEDKILIIDDQCHVRVHENFC
jgi:hypothetical protein